MKLSIITICYNEPRLEETLKSVVNQTFQDFEWVVVDGGSNQETLDIFSKYKHRINKFISEKDNGVYNAMNKGIKMAQGEYLLFLNAGDSLYDENVLNNFINSNLDKDIIYANLYLNQTGEHKYPDTLDEKFWITSSLPHPATLIKKELFEKYGLYNENYKIISDYEKWLEFILKEKCTFKHVDFIGTNFDTTGISSNKKYKETHENERQEVMLKYFTEDKIFKIRLSEVTYSFTERLFSIKNHPNGKFKIISILGIKFIIKRKSK